MNNILNIAFNNNLVTTITYNGSPVDVLNFNNNQWTSVSPEFKLYPILIDSNGSYTFEDYCPRYISLSGNSVFLVKSKDLRINLLEVDISRYGSNSVLFDPIDNFGYIGSRYYLYDKWPGGLTGTSFLQTSSFIYNNNTISLIFNSSVDENNSVLLEGCFVTKIIRIPSNGVSGYFNYDVYPYTFSSNYFNDEIEVFLYDYKNMNILEYNTFYYNLHKINNNQVLDYTPSSSDVIFNSINISYLGLLKFRVDFDIAPNYSGNYKDTAIYSEGTLVHFIQEPYSSCRIYFGGSIYEGTFFNNSTSDEDRFHSYGSIDLNNKNYFELTYSNSTKWSIMYPKNLSETFNIEIDQTNLEVSEESDVLYQWNGIRYVIRNSNFRTNKYIFTRK